LIKRRSRDAEGLGGACHPRAVDPDTAEHLVLDLHEIARIEEVAPAKGLVGDARRSRVERATPAEGLQLGIGLRAAGHMEVYLRLLTVGAQENARSSRP